MSTVSDKTDPLRNLLQLEAQATDNLLGWWRGEPLLVAFFIPLPVALELAHHSSFMFERDEIVEWLKGQPHRHLTSAEPRWIPRISDEGRNFVSLRIWRPRESLAPASEPLRAALRVVDALATDEELGGGPLADGMPELFADTESYGTVVEAVTPLIREPAQDLQAVVSAALDRCIEETAALMRSYLLMTRNIRVQPVSRQNLYPFVPYVTQHPFTGDFGGLGVIRANNGVGFVSDSIVLPEERHQELMVHMSRLKSGDPVSVSTEWARLSRRAYEVDGDYRVAVIASHTAAEVWFDTLLLMMAWEEGGVTPEVVAGWFGGNLVNRISRHYATRLGGPWQPADPNTVIGRWVVRVNRLRHLVLHAGYQPTDPEARAALDAFRDLEEFLTQRLAEKRHKYPRTTLLHLGTPGLVRRGLLDRRMQEFIATVAATEDDWIDSFKPWVEQIYSLLGI